MDSTEKRRGYYLGTELGGKWWRRYSKGGLLARGTGEYWIDSSALFFRRFLSETPIVIFLEDVLDVRLGKWHSGRWAGGAPVVKIVWREAEELLSSGFVFSRKSSETETLVREIRSHARGVSGTNIRSGPTNGIRSIGRDRLHAAPDQPPGRGV